MKLSGLDKRDTKLLALLDRNSRMPLTQLAKAIALSKQATHRRLQLLHEQGHVHHTYPVIAFQKLGFLQHKLYLKFRPMEEAQEQEVVRYLLGLRGVIWVASCRGRWDLAVTTTSQDIYAFAETYDDFAKAYGGYVLDKDIFVVRDSNLYTRAYLGMEKTIFPYLERGTYTMDDIDKRLVRKLSKDARQSLLSLSHEIGISRTALQHRLKRLENARVILGYRALFDLRKMGILLYKVIIKLNTISEDVLKRLEAFNYASEYGTQFLRVIGNNDVELEFEVPSEDAFYEILLALRKEFSDVMHSYDTLLVFKEHDIKLLAARDQ